MRFYTVVVRGEMGADKQFVLLSKDLPASFQPYRSAAQFAAADAPPPLLPPAHSLPRAASMPRLGLSSSTLLEPTAAHHQRQQMPAHVSLATIQQLAEQQRARALERMSHDPFARAFSREEPTRVLASRREHVRSRLAKDKADEAAWLREKQRRRGGPTVHAPGERSRAELLEASYDPSRLPAPIPALLDFAKLDGGADAPPGSPAGPHTVSSLERQRRAAMLKLFTEHEYKMRAVQSVRAPKRYVPPPVRGLEADRLQLEKDSTRLMRKLILRPRSHTFE